MALQIRVLSLLLVAGVGLYVLFAFSENKPGLWPHYITSLQTSLGGLKKTPSYVGEAVTLQPDVDEDGSRKVKAPPFWQGEGGVMTEEMSLFVPNTSRHRDEVRHIVFVKVHKAAGSTLGRVLRRFAKSRALNVMLPASGLQELSQGHPGVGRLAPHPKSPPFLFDIAYHHVVFRHAVMSPYFPPDTTYMAIMREPFQQVYRNLTVRSAYYYYRHIQKSMAKNESSFEEFARNQSRYEKRRPYGSFTNNRQSIDMGLNARHLGNASHVQPFVRQLAAQFHLVLIQESFPQSLVLMRRALRWTMKDVLYLDSNVGKSQVLMRRALRWTKKDALFLDSNVGKVNYVLELVGLLVRVIPQSQILMRRALCWTMKDVLFVDTNVGKHKPPATFQPDKKTRAAFQRFQMFDVAVYRHFLTVFQRKVAEQGPDFEDEVRVFQQVQKRIAFFCGQADGDRSPALVIPSSRWNEAFTYRSADCRALSKGVSNDEALERQMLRLFPGKGSPR